MSTRAQYSLVESVHESKQYVTNLLVCAHLELELEAVAFAITYESDRLTLLGSSNISMSES